jgi:hypothetical protein
MENENKPKNKKRYYKRRPKKNPADNAAAGPNVSPSADPVAPNGSNGSTGDSTIATESRRPKGKAKGKPKQDPKTIAWEDAKSVSAAERGIDQLGLPAMPKWTEPKKSAIEDANITASKNNIATVKVDNANIETSNVIEDRMKWNLDNSANSDDAKHIASKSDYLLREHRLISAIALLAAFLGIVTTACIWWLLTH